MTPRSESGFTLVEVLVTMFVFAIVSVGFYQVMFSGSRGADTSQRVVNISEEARLGFNRLIRDTREATSLDCPPVGSVCPGANGYSIIVDFDGDDIPELAIGRLPVRTANDAALLVSKITGYEQGPVAGWRSEVILAADDNELFDFEGATTSVENLMPPDVSITKILLGQTDPATARNTLLNGLNAGKLFVNYYGHGSVQLWADPLHTLVENPQALKDAK